MDDRGIAAAGPGIDPERWHEPKPKTPTGERNVGTMALVLMRIRELASAPLTQKRFHGWLALFWFAFIFPAYEMGLLKSIVFLSAINFYALGVGHFSSWQAAKIEVKQEAIEDEKDQEAEARIEEKIEGVAEKIDASKL